jgi:hypothetical protein
LEVGRNGREEIMPKGTSTMAAVAGLALAMAACGGSSDPSAPTTVSPSSVSATPPKAHITVTLGLDTVTGPSLDPKYAAYVRFTSNLTESAGLGATLNYVRGEFYESGHLAERYDVSASELVAESGSDRIEALSSRSLVLTLRHRAPCDMIRITFQFTDDKGNDHYLVGNLGPVDTVMPASGGGTDAPRL